MSLLSCMKTCTTMSVSADFAGISVTSLYFWANAFHQSQHAKKAFKYSAINWNALAINKHTKC